MTTIMKPHYGSMKTSVHLRRGRVKRTIALTAVVAPSCWDPFAIARAIGAFAAGVDAGLFGDTTASFVLGAVREAHGTSQSEASCEIEFPPLPEEAFAVLARAMKASIIGLQRLELREKAREPLLVVKGFDREDERTLPDVPWEVLFAIGDIPQIAVELEDVTAADSAAQIRELFSTWTTLVGLGAYRGSRLSGSSMAEAWRVDALGEHSVVARFVSLDTEHSAFEALFFGLQRIHELVPIARVTITLSASHPTVAVWAGLSAPLVRDKRMNAHCTGARARSDCHERAEATALGDRFRLEGKADQLAGDRVLQERTGLVGNTGCFNPAEMVNRRDHIAGQHQRSPVFRPPNGERERTHVEA